jgi:long-chain fatty acid transport protein
MMHSWISRASRAAACLLFLASACAQRASASAFAIGEQGARAAGMGTAFTAVADDGAAIFYNPAGIAFQSGMHMQMDAMAVVGLFRFFPSDPLPGQQVPSNGFSGSVKPKFIPVGSMYMTKQIRPNVTFGFGLFAPFGLSANFTNFNDGDPNLTKYPGRFAGTRAALQSFWFQPTIGYKFNESHAIGIGVALVHTHLLIEQSILNPLDDALDFGREAADTVFPGVDKELAARSIARMLPEGRSRIAGTSNGPGFNLAYLYRNQRYKTNIGFNFRSAVTNHLKGKASFAFGDNYTLKQFVGEDLLFKAFPNQEIHGSFTTPALYSVGVANRSFGDLLLSFDVHLQDFKRFSSVPLNFSVTEASNKDVRTPAERRLIFDFRNSWQIAVGAEKPLGKFGMTARAGYLFDYSPVVDKAVGPLFPDNNRHSITVGGTRQVGNKELTFFYEAMMFVDRNVFVPENIIKGTNGLYQNFAHLIGLSMRINKDSNK